MSVVTQESWETIRLFFYCYSRAPGFSGWTIQRTGYPGPGSVGDQDARTMQAFDLLEHEFYAIQGELSEEGRRAKELERTHREVQRSRVQG